MTTVNQTLLVDDENVRVTRYSCFAYALSIIT
jgi:hypothetical protein